MSSKKLKKWTSNPLEAAADLTLNAMTGGTVGYNNGKIQDGMSVDAVQSVGKNLKDVTGITAAEAQIDATRQTLLDEQKARETQRLANLQQQQATEMQMSTAAASRRKRSRGSATATGAADDLDLSTEFLGV